MRSRLRPAFRLFTVALFALTAWTAYANVLSDDAEVRARAEQAARAKAGCGDKCKIVDAHGTRGMLGESIAYTIDGRGVVTVDCRRPYVAFGDFACEAASSAHAD